MQYSRAMRIIGLIGQGVLLGLGCGAAAAATPPAQDLAVLQRWPLGGAGGWDYLTLDAAGQRLFISRSDHVDVVNTETGKIVGTIPGPPGGHGIALAEDLKRGFTSNGRGDSVTVFDLNTLEVVKEVPVSG